MEVSPAELRRRAERVLASDPSSEAQALAEAVLEALAQDESLGDPYRTRPQGLAPERSSSADDTELLRTVVDLERELEICRRRVASLERALLEKAGA